MAFDRKVAAIHHQLSASDVGGFIRGEEEHRLGHFFPLALATQRHLGNHLGTSGWIGRASGRPHRGHSARMDGVDTDTMPLR